MPIKVLLIDDQKNYCIALAGEARQHNIDITDAQNLEIGLEKLNEDKSLQFVILDGKCLMDEDQEIPKENFVHAAIEQIKELRYTDNRIVPFCVNTGFMKDLSASLDGRAKVFQKEHDSTPMFEFISSEVQKLDVTNLKSKYSKAFEIFENGWLNISHQDKLIKILEALEENKHEKEHFNVIRDLYEECLKTLQNNFKHFPTELFKSGRPNLSSCTIYLQGRKTKDHNSNQEFDPTFKTPQHISWLLSSVQGVCNIFSHAYNERSSEFAFQSTATALLEVLYWLPDYTKKNYG